MVVSCAWNPGQYFRFLESFLSLSCAEQISGEVQEGGHDAWGGYPSKTEGKSSAASGDLGLDQE